MINLKAELIHAAIVLVTVTFVMLTFRFIMITRWGTHTNHEPLAAAILVGLLASDILHQKLYENVRSK